ncbi:hypothetical protein [Faecalicoccus pleomorphus]|uniref:hypothetical protein n=1 Tax=Faecalicoccus pleomorphus TaxID=1323 RepID=UPI002942237C|nr:hypothetical protein [Faecalicoccus pleomorphus]
MLNYSVYLGFVKKPIRLKDKHGKAFLQNDLKVERPYRSPNSGVLYDTIPFRLTGQAAQRFADLYARRTERRDAIVLAGRMTTIETADQQRINILDVNEFYIPGIGSNGNMKSETETT